MTTQPVDSVPVTPGCSPALLLVRRTVPGKRWSPAWLMAPNGTRAGSPMVPALSVLEVVGRITPTADDAGTVARAGRSRGGAGVPAAGESPGSTLVALCGERLALLGSRCPRPDRDAG